MISLLPNLITTNIEDLDCEFQNVKHQSNVSTHLDFEEFWNNIFLLKNGLNETMYPNLRYFVGTILGFPHSSATAERIFSHLNIVKNKKRNCLNVKTVNSIMVSLTILDKIDASAWTPSESLIQKYNKVKGIVKLSRHLQTRIIVD